MSGTTDVSEIIAQLSNSKSEKRSSAAKKLRKKGYTEAGSAVFEALKEELADPRTWKAQFEMILALGELKYQAALPFLWELTRVETPHTILYTALGDAIVRLSSKDKSDVACIFELARTGNYSLINGAFNAMSELRLVPSDADIEKILQIADNPRADIEYQGHPNDRTGVRLHVALAAAGWPRELVRPFLEKCLTIPDKGLQLAATSSLKGKYTKWASF